MQQHTGQHLLSHAFYALFGAHSLGLHIGAEDAYVDLRLDGGPLPEQALSLAEILANDLIYADLPVRQFFPTPEELKKLPLRKEPDAHENLRVVQIGPEAVACCGTHLPSTGQARLVLALRSQASHGNLRVFFLAGDRALQRAKLCVREATAAAAALSCPVGSLFAMVQRLQGEQKELARELNREKTQSALLALRQKAPLEIAGETVLLAGFEGLEPRPLQEAAAALPGGASIACLFSRQEGGVTAALARSGAGGRSMAELFSAFSAAFGGKGGGRADFAQGRLKSYDEGKALGVIRDFLNKGD
jgi:alanyl-tRNA synthetase